jgi:glycosyltransferase involved in cell wall biosynthesis
MRVLHLIPSVVGGGAERQLTYLAAGQRALGLDVHVGILREGINMPRLERSGAIIHRLGNLRSYDPRIVPRAARIIRRVRPDIVQTWLAQMDVAGGAAAFLTRTPWIATERSSGAHYPNDIRYRMRRIAGRFASAVIANSPAGLASWRHSRAKPFMVPNAVPLDEIAAAEPSREDFGAARIILFVGRIDAEKNLPNLIDALVPIVTTTDSVALFCGIGPLEDATRRLIESTGCANRIRLLGFRNDVWDLMKRADVLVAPSWFEGHPNAVIEAAACGCPLVVSEIPAHRAFLDDATALFAPPEDSAALSAAIVTALQDRGAAMARAARARAIVAEWSIANISRAYARIYEQLTA